MISAVLLLGLDLERHPVLGKLRLRARAGAVARPASPPWLRTGSAGAAPDRRSAGAPARALVPCGHTPGRLSTYSRCRLHENTPTRPRAARTNVGQLGLPRPRSWSPPRCGGRAPPGPSTSSFSVGCTKGSPPEILTSQRPGKRRKGGQEARRVAAPAPAIFHEALRAVRAAVVARGVDVPAHHTLGGHAAAGPARQAGSVGLLRRSSEPRQTARFAGRVFLSDARRCQSLRSCRGWPAPCTGRCRRGTGSDGPTA